MKKIKKLSKPLLALLLVFAIIVVHTLYVGVAICWYGKQDEIVKADVAIVLGAGVKGNKPNSVYQERINHGIWLYENDYVEKIILTGGKGEGNKYSDAFIAKEFAVSHGVPAEDVLIEEKSTTTIENIAYANEIIEDNGYSTALIVSDPLHMKRAMLIADDLGLEAYSSPTPTTKYTGLVSRSKFLCREVVFYTGYELYRIFD